MHLVLVVIVILTSIRFADWKNWERYYPTMLYVSTSGLLYKYFAHSQFHLWKIEPSWIINTHSLADIVHTFIINPLAAFMYLSNLKIGFLKEVIHILKWAIIGISFEWIFWKFGLISFHHGWSLLWSFVFYCTMFAMLKLHFKHKIWALVLSIFFTLFYLIVFDYI